MADFPEPWLPEEEISKLGPVAQRRTRLAKEITRLHWDIIRDDAPAQEIVAAGFASADLLLSRSTNVKDLEEENK